MIGVRLRELREQQQLTQQELADRVGSHVNQVVRWENGKTMPTVDALARLSKELEVSADYLLGLVDQPNGHLSQEDLTPLERKFLAASDRGDLAAMLDIVLEMYREEPSQAHVGTGVSRANAENQTGVTKRSNKD